MCIYTYRGLYRIVYENDSNNRRTCNERTTKLISNIENRYLKIIDN